jgi:hypothetical protein
MIDFTCPNCGESCYPDDPCPCRDLDEESRARIGRLIQWKNKSIADLEARLDKFLHVVERLDAGAYTTWEGFEHAVRNAAK